MEGFLNLRIRPWLRRLITRLLAVVPALAVIIYYGENATGAMLVLSQVVLSLQLPFAIIPLIHAVADKKSMGEFSIKPWIQALAWLTAIIILGLNIKLVVDQITSWIQTAGNQAWILRVTVVPFVLALGVLLLYIIVHPWLRNRIEVLALTRTNGVHRLATQSQELTTPRPYQRIAIALDFSSNEEKLLEESLRYVERGLTQVTLLHVVESPVARVFGIEGADREARSDQERLESLAENMRGLGVNAEIRLGAGEPVSQLASMINELQVEMVIVGSHGHSGVSDLIHGTVISNLRHHIHAKLLIVPLG